MNKKECEGCGHVMDRVVLKMRMTLCISHHKDFHHQYGCKNNTKEQFDKYLTEENE